MKLQAAGQTQQHDRWPQPFRRKRYDRTPTLSDIEQATLEQVFCQQLQIRGKTKRALLRLYQPLADVCNQLHTPQPVASRVVRTLFLEIIAAKPRSGAGLLKHGGNVFVRPLVCSPNDMGCPRKEEMPPASCSRQSPTCSVRT